MPGIRIVHKRDLPPPREVRPQVKNGRKAAVYNQQIDRTPERAVLYTRYDPGLVLERHSHFGDEIIHVLEGDLMVGDQLARAGATIILEKGTPFGPLRAGEHGTTILEIFVGPDASRPRAADPEAFRDLLRREGITILDEPDPTVPPSGT